MTRPNVECTLAFSRELNPNLDTDPNAKRRKEIICTRVSRSVREFLFDHVKPEYRSSYPDKGIDPTWGYKSGPSTDLLMVEIFLPPREQMADMTSTLQRLLIKKLVHELPELRQRVTVTIGPVKKAAA
jgi:hypothetical protein